MSTKTTLALVFALTAPSGALAATKTHSIGPSQETVYNPAGAEVGTDSDLNVRFELRRDSDQAH
jgi:hypothetical protein